MSTHLPAWLLHLSPPKLYSFSSCLSSKFRNCVFRSSSFTMHTQLLSETASQLVCCLQTVPQSVSTWSHCILSITETSLGRSSTEQTLHPDTQNVCDPTLMSVQLYVFPSFSSPWTLQPDVQFPALTCGLLHCFFTCPSLSYVLHGCFLAGASPNIASWD